jgi:hydrophobe/amphiphile efflux-1 (HAE1) family protein
VDRPIFASVIAVIITLLGAIAYGGLPVTQYPAIAPPTIQITASYPGASAEVAADTVATPLEQEVNGVEGMIYMLSQSTGDGSVTLSVTFEVGTDLDVAQVLVQNRVAAAEPRLPAPVRAIGVATQKSSPDLLMVVNLFSPDDSYDQLYIANYATLQIRDTLARIGGVGQIRLFGASEYAMRIWLDPDLIKAVDLTAAEVVASLRQQNVQVSAGTLNAPPSRTPNAFEIGVQAMGRLTRPEQFEDIIVRSSDEGRIVRLKDVARIELGAQSYTTRGFLRGKPAVALPIFQTPGTNALQTASEVKETMATLAREFPPGLAYTIGYNPTEFIDQSVAAVVKTIFEAVALVVFVIFLFLQTWRASLIPIIAIPVSLIGTFSVMAALGFSLNNLTLFGLVLAIGIVVDDAIVVVENVERHIRDGLSPREASHRTMDEVSGALVALGLVLVAVFVPAAFVPGISGAFYQQFALTIATATMISVLVSLTLSPALCAVLLKPAEASGDTSRGSGFFRRFNRSMDGLSSRYAKLTGGLVRRGGLVLIVYVGLLLLTALQFSAVPGGFIPDQDQGYAIVSIELPAGAERERTDAVAREVSAKLLTIDGIENAIGFSGFSGATFTSAPNAATLFTPFKPFDERPPIGALTQEMREVVATIEDASVLVIQPPPIRGIGNAGGFRMMIEDRRGRGLEMLEDTARELTAAANAAEGITRAYSLFNTSTPQLYLDIDRERAERLRLPTERVFDTIEIYLGSAYVNDFNYLGRTFRVTAQADAPFRASRGDILRLNARNDLGEQVPLGSVASARYETGPYRVMRYNLYPAASVYGSTLPGTSSSEAIETMESLAAEMLPNGLSFEWTELAYQQKQAGSTGLAVFVFSIVFVFLLLAAQYESLSLPLAVILIVPMCMLFAMFGIWVSDGDNNILVQVGLIVLVALAAKNAILIVEFAKQKEDAGQSRFEAAVTAARLRLRPILMTSLAFILGVVPLVIATGPGAEMRRALGITVFSGMLGVTLFGLLFTPVFYSLCRAWARKTPEANDAG